MDLITDTGSKPQNIRHIDEYKFINLVNVVCDVHHILERNINFHDFGMLFNNGHIQIQFWFD
jgi:hypothetical protein